MEALRSVDSVLSARVKLDEGHGSGQDAATSTNPGLHLLEQYLTCVGEARNIRKELRTLQALQGRQRTEQSDIDSENRADQRNDAASRLTEKTEEVNALKQRCIALGIYRSPSPSSGSDHVEMSSEAGMDYVLGRRSSSRSPPRFVNTQDEEPLLSKSNGLIHATITSTGDQIRLNDGQLPDIIQPKRSILIQRCSGEVHIETKSNDFQINIQDHEGPIHIEEGSKLSDHNLDTQGVEEDKDAKAEVLPYLHAERAKDIKITEEIAKAAAQNQKHREKTMMLLPRNHKTDRRISQAIKAATSNESSTVESLRSGTLVDTDASTFDGWSSNALQAAAYNGHEKIVLLLLKCGADANARRGQFGNALQGASERGHEQIVRLLVDNGADVNAQGGDFGGALQAASFRGHEQIVKLLVDSGANVNAQGGYYGNALQGASARGHEQIVRLLIKNGADVNAQGGDFGNALQAASFRGHEQIVRLLIDFGADVNAQGGRYSNALQAASKRGYVQIVRLLVDSGADVNVQCGPFIDANSSSGDLGSGHNASSTPQFDVFEWHPVYQSCQRYFLDHAQHDNGVQAVAALINICLPFQWTSSPVMDANGLVPHSSGPAAYDLPWPKRRPATNSPGQTGPAWVSLVPYIRRLIITGMDREGIMHGFFGDNWQKGVGPLHECERRNYLFAAKSVGWAKVKDQYDMSPHESVPFIKPLQVVQLSEIESAEKTWGQWLAMEDWMVGPHGPNADDQPQYSVG